MFKAVFKNHQNEVLFELNEKFNSEEKAWDAIDSEMESYSENKSRVLIPGVVAEA